MARKIRDFYLSIRNLRAKFVPFGNMRLQLSPFQIRLLTFMSESLLIALAGYIAFQLRFNFLIPDPWTPRILPVIVWMTGSQLLFWLLFGVYKSPLARFTIDDVQKVLFALLASIAFLTLINYLNAHYVSEIGQRLVPHTVLVIGHFGTLFFWISLRLLFRNVYHYRHPHIALEASQSEGLWKGMEEILLGREPIRLESESVKNQLAGKTVLVTGAAGSIGRELTRQLTHFSVKKLILLDQAETPLYDLEMDLKGNEGGCELEIVVADIRNKARMQSVFAKHRPQIVYHAAAYKHVPMMEKNPVESLQTNTFGTQNMADLSVQYGVEKFIFVSTDKAVNPTSIMGASKRLAEMYVQSLDADLEANQKNGTRFVTTRFGNVLGSDGSVYLLFQKQILLGGPLTVTHPEVTRYFMTIPEASQLVLEAGAMGKGGEVYVFDMGKSVKIMELAKKMVEFYAERTGKTIKISTIGLRPGEKLYEEVLHEAEENLPTHHAKILIGKVVKYEHAFVVEEMAKLHEALDRQHIPKIIQLLRQVIPEYKSQNSEFELY